MYKPIPLGQNLPKSMLKTLTKLIQVYHHLAALSLVSGELEQFAPDYWVQFWGQEEYNHSALSGKLYDYYYSFIPFLWSSFKNFYSTPEEVHRDFNKCLKWFEERVPGHVLDIQRAKDRLDVWIGCLQPAVELVIPSYHQRYPNPQQKFKYWHLPNLTKTIAIVGDSNLARIEPFAHSSCQVESFPGARIEHIRHLFDTYVSQFVPKILILSIGINDVMRNQTLKTNYGTIVSHLPIQFRETKIFLVELQVSKSQPAEVHQKAKILNESVPVEVHLIPGIPSFETGRDGVHWTPPCANNLINHWLNYTK